MLNPVHWALVALVLIIAAAALSALRGLAALRRRVEQLEYQQQNRAALRIVQPPSPLPPGATDRAAAAQHTHTKWSART